MKTRTKLFALAGLSLVFSLSPAWGQATITCPQTSGPTAWSGGTLDTDTTKNGVVFDGTSSALKLQPAAGLFQSTTLGISDLTVFASSARWRRCR